ncbi:phage tail sheath family protein [Amycolatopsis sp. cg5]|uniref:phage tail sheath family protein n=1 Tax=Amycolatopsis sp. cg5 TaxID=3238802 RepID=UPI003526ABE4
MPTYLSPGVYVEEVSSGSRPIEGVGTAVAGFVGFAERGPVHQPTLVTNWTQFTKAFGGFIDGAYLPHAVYGYFLNGGGSAYIVRLPGGDGERVALCAGAEIPAAEPESKASLSVRALAAGTGGNALVVTVEEATQKSPDAFKIEVQRNGKTEETFDNLTVRRGPANVLGVLAKQSKLIELVAAKDGRLPMPKTGTRIQLAGGNQPKPVDSKDYIGDTGDRTGFSGLEAVEEVTMLCVPDLMSAYQRGLVDDDGLKAVQLAMIAHCELMADRVAVLDPPPGLGAQRAAEWRTELAGYDSKYAALYWPWLRIMDPLSGAPVIVPPSGHLAGVWARNDDTRGVHKAPANEVLRGVIAPETMITKGEQDLLNPIGVNCIRAFPGQGIRVWGARTLASDPLWRYVNVRRLFNFVEKSILLGTNWVVFEPNDEYLWESVSRTITMFLRQVWRSGALIGRTPTEAFYVKCDGENNPPESRDAGTLFVEIGIAPVKPAEFVVFRISQFAQGAALEE